MSTQQAASNADLELIDLLDPRCVAQVACLDAEDALGRAAALLADVGAVGKEYAEEVVAREREFPTGLATQPVGVALPHADKGILRSAIALLALREPVFFQEMGNADNQVPVGLVILLALPAGEKHVQALATLAEMIQQPGALAEMMRAGSADELYQVFRKWTLRVKSSPQ